MFRESVSFWSTNNSTNSRVTYAKKFAGSELKHLRVFGSTYAVAYYVKHILKFPEDKRVFVRGMDEIVDEMAAEGVQLCAHYNLGGQRELTFYEPDGNSATRPFKRRIAFGFALTINYKNWQKPSPI
ncbi:hypothetical protein BJ742DRAFT_736679 [Cladochytrium replicatum]|nr:hypothetical protein BJ742DRAFT_736679 [Cladochytrium replicatum]